MKLDDLLNAQIRERQTSTVITQISNLIIHVMSHILTWCVTVLFPR